MTKKKHRPGGPGRPPKGSNVERMNRYQITLPREIADAIREQGDGNLSLGVRRLVLTDERKKV